MHVTKRFAYYASPEAEPLAGEGHWRAVRFSQIAVAQSQVGEGCALSQLKVGKIHGSGQPGTIKGESLEIEPLGMDDGQNGGHPLHSLTEFVALKREMGEVHQGADGQWRSHIQGHQQHLQHLAEPNAPNVVSGAGTHRVAQK